MISASRKSIPLQGPSLHYREFNMCLRTQSNQRTENENLNIGWRLTVRNRLTPLRPAAKCPSLALFP